MGQSKTSSPSFDFEGCYCSSWSAHVYGKPSYNTFDRYFFIPVKPSTHFQWLPTMKKCPSKALLWTYIIASGKKKHPPTARSSLRALIIIRRTEASKTRQAPRKAWTLATSLPMQHLTTLLHTQPKKTRQCPGTIGNAQDKQALARSHGVVVVFAKRQTHTAQAPVKGARLS